MVSSIRRFGSSPTVLHFFYTDCYANKVVINKTVHALFVHRCACAGVLLYGHPRSQTLRSFGQWLVKIGGGLGRECCMAKYKAETSALNVKHNIL